MKRAFFLALVAATVPAGAQTLYTTGFESPFAGGPLGGQQGWNVDEITWNVNPLFAIDTTFARNGSQSVQADTSVSFFGNNWAYIPIDFTPTSTRTEVIGTVYVYLEAALGVGSSQFGLDAVTNVPSVQRIAAVTVNSLGEVRLIGPTGAAQKAVGTVTPSAWNRLDLVVDFETSSVRAKVNGTDIGLSTSFTGGNLADFDLLANALGDQKAYFDDFSVAATQRVIQGEVTLQDWTGDASLETVRVQVVDGTTVVETFSNVALDANGRFIIETPLKGTYKLRVKGQHWLTDAVSPVTLPATTATSFELINGDIDGDDSITVFDYDILSANFDKTSADADWDTTDVNGIKPRFADLDNDDSVTVFDYDILSKNFDLIGDL